MKIPKIILEEIEDLLVKELADIYNDTIFETTNKEFRVFLEEVMFDILSEIDALLEVTKDVLYLIKKNRKQFKKRWYEKSLKDSKSAFHFEINIIANRFVSNFKKEDLEKFRLVYEVESIDALKDKICNEMLEWVKNDEKLIVSYKYIFEKENRQIINAFANDIKYIVYSIVYEKCPMGEHSYIYSMPNSLANIPIDYTNRAKIAITNPIETLDVNGKYREYLVDKYYIDNDTVFESYIAVENLKEEILKDYILKKLNATDVKIFLYIMSLRDETFIKNRTINVDIGDVVKNVFKSDNKKNYMTVKGSLYKMERLGSGAYNKSLQGFTVQIFDNVDIVRANDDNREFAIIVVNNNIVNQYIRNQTISMYKPTIDKFTLDSSKILIYPIQSERVQAYINNKENQELKLITNINFFKRILYFSNKRKRENIVAIENALNEIVLNKIALKKYERKGDIFTLYFYDVTEKEKRDLLSSFKALDNLIIDTNKINLAIQ